MWLAALVLLAFAALASFDFSTGHRARAVGELCFGVVGALVALRGRSSTGG
jgi:hypothetical protein